MSVASSENQDHDEVTAILTSVCEDETTIGVLHKFLCDSHITKARSLATLSPALIAAASTQLRAPDEGDQKMDGTLWKGVVASLLAAARDEALAQIEHQVLLAKQELTLAEGPSDGDRSKSARRAKPRAYTTALKLVASRLGRPSLPPSLVPPQRLLETLRLNIAVFVDFKRYFPQSSASGARNDVETRVAESLDGLPVLVRASGSSSAEQDRSRSYCSQWVRCFLVFAIALLTIQEDSTTTEATEVPAVTEAGADRSTQEVQVVDLLSYLDRILWYATQYGFKTASEVDEAVRRGIEAECRGSGVSLGACYRDWNLWTSTASEIVGLNIHSRSVKVSPAAGDKRPQGGRSRAADGPQRGQKRPPEDYEASRVRSGKLPRQTSPPAGAQSGKA